MIGLYLSGRFEKISKSREVVRYTAPDSLLVSFCARHIVSEETPGSDVTRPVQVWRSRHLEAVKVIGIDIPTS